jgi:hypothetical protein
MNTERQPAPKAAPTQSGTLFGILQRKCACGGSMKAEGECDECKQNAMGLQRRGNGGGAAPSLAPPIVHNVLRSPGRPLDKATRAFFEPRFGHDFSKVRIHADDQAAESARAVSAVAYTVGRDVVFGAGQYAPATMGGRKLLAHELSHVTQQTGASGGVTSGAFSRGDLVIGPPSDLFEVEANKAEQGLGSAGSSATHLGTSAVIQRKTNLDPFTAQLTPGESGVSDPSFSRTLLTSDARSCSLRPRTSSGVS